MYLSTSNWQLQFDNTKAIWKKKILIQFLSFNNQLNFYNPAVVAWFVSVSPFSFSRLLFVANGGFESPSRMVYWSFRGRNSLSLIHNKAGRQSRKALQYMPRHKLIYEEDEASRQAIGEPTSHKKTQVDAVYGSCLQRPRWIVTWIIWTEI